jgi:hypothetical protein
MTVDPIEATTKVVPSGTETYTASESSATRNQNMNTAKTLAGPAEAKNRIRKGRIMDVKTIAPRVERNFYQGAAVVLIFHLFTSHGEDAVKSRWETAPVSTDETFDVTGHVFEIAESPEEKFNS